MGNILLYLTIAFSILSILFIKKSKISKWLITAQFVTSLGMTVYMLWLFLGNHFEFRYVFHNSSISLPWYYKISALWAGDSGSLIFWLVIISGLIFFLHLRKKLKPSLLMTLLVFQLFILVSIFISTPFAISTKSYIDGQGMNLLLKNFWMMSHPPVVFIAYSTLIIPFGYTIWYFIQKNISFDKWRENVTPWIIASWFFLGLGIVLGAIWSYEVIGWGGYWGWDPVENASLIPWILLTGAVHALLTSKSSKTGKRSSFGFTLASFVSMIIAIFITRSGILADVSVHSFSGKPIAIILGILLFVSVVVSVLLYLKLRERIEKETEPSLTSRPFVVGAGNLVLIIFSAVVLVATLWPVISKLFGESQSLSAHFYSTILAPVGILLALGITVTPFFKWNETNIREFVKKMIGPMFVAIITIWLFFEFGMTKPVLVIVIFLSVTGICASFIKMKSLPAKKWGAYITHIGMAILLIGVVVSSNYHTSEQQNLSEGGETQHVLERNISLNDFSIIDESGDYVAEITIEDMNGNKRTANINGLMDINGSWVVTPNIKRSLWTDVTISPGRPEPGILLAPTLDEAVTGNGYELSLIKLETDTVSMKLTFENETWKFSAERTEDGLFTLSEPAEDLSIFLEEVGNDYVRARITDLRSDVGKTVMLPVKVSEKYFITFVWIGMILALLGILWALLSRYFFGKRLHE